MNIKRLLALPIFIGFFSCQNQVVEDSVNDGIEIITVDLSKATDGKLSDFVEGEIEYIWLSDENEAGQVGGFNQKIFFHQNRIFVLDVFGCKCIKIFNRDGEYLTEISRYGEGPGEYLEFDDAIIHDEELILFGVFPHKIMWFTLEGEFLREKKLDEYLGAGRFDAINEQYLFDFPFSKEPGKHQLKLISEDFQDTTSFFPYDEKRYYGNSGSRENFRKNNLEVFYSRPYSDTIYQIGKEGPRPRFVFDFGEYGQQTDVLKANSQNMGQVEFLDFLNKEAGLSFIPFSWFVTNSNLYARFSSRGKLIHVRYDRLRGEVFVADGLIEDDIHSGYNTYGFIHQFEDYKYGIQLPGKSLYEILETKKSELNNSEYLEYVNGKGKALGEVAAEARNSENPVLLIYTLKN